MKEKAYCTIQKYHMLSHGDTVIVGLSGGADSCALLHFLVSLRESMHLTVAACHVNHGLRGSEADRDEHFAGEFCRKYDVKLYTLHADVRKEAVKQKKSTEQCGRDIRYAFFTETAEKLDGKIATAHTASDNAETVLFNLTRGSGMAGLCGIPPARDRIIRPLIECTRTEIEDYCKMNNLSYVTDSTNLTEEYTRNRIRLKVIPVLKNINPCFESAVSGMTERLRQTSDFMVKCAENALTQAETDKGYDIKVLQGLDEALMIQTVRLLCQRNGITPEAKHMELMKQMIYNGGAVELKENIFAVSRQGYFRIVREENRDFTQSIVWNGQKSLYINDKKISLSEINIDEFHKRKKIDKMLFHNSLDYDTIPLTPVFRTRQQGDQFCLPDRRVTKSVKKLFIEMKIPREKRDGIVLLAHGSEILWIEGIGISDQFRVGENTRKVLMIECERKMK